MSSQPKEQPTAKAGSMASSAKLRQGSTEAVILRADGTREYLGVVSYYHRNPVKRFGWQLYRWLGRYYNPPRK